MLVLGADGPDGADQYTLVQLRLRPGRRTPHMALTAEEFNRAESRCNEH